MIHYWRRGMLLLAAAAVALCLARAASAQATDVAYPFKEGDTILFADLERVKGFLPPEYWDNRAHFFFDGMEMEIGPFHTDYTPSDYYKRATEKLRSQATLNEKDQLKDFTAGQPFPIDGIDRADPKAGLKIAWDFNYRWQYAGGSATWRFFYFDNGKKLPKTIEGTAHGAQFWGRSDREEVGYTLIPNKKNEKTQARAGLAVKAPFDLRGTAGIGHRYLDTETPDDIYVYLPSLRRVRHFTQSQRSDSQQGTDFTFDDLNSFSGIVPHYRWKLLGEREVLAPINPKVDGYPINKKLDFGPSGVSRATDRWELRRAILLELVPKKDDHPYGRKIMYIDRDSFKPLYSFAYDRKNELWKVIYHVLKWSERDGSTAKDGKPAHRLLNVVTDIIVNVQTGTGNRIEFFDVSGEPWPLKKDKRYFDVGRLDRGR